MSLHVAILGATGLVGRTALRVLEERRLPIDELRLLASDHGERTLPFGGRPHRVETVSPSSFAGIDLAIFTCGNEVSRAWAEIAQNHGARVVDNSSAFRYQDGVPLVVPEVNGELLVDRPTLVANPNCSVIALAMALAPLSRAAGLERVDVATYQAVSGAGSEALEELERGVREGLAGDPPPSVSGAPPFAFNVVPHIDRFEDNGYSREEMKIVWELRKILGLPALAVTATAVRVPVRVGHAAAVTVTLSRAVRPEEARALWSSFPGIELVDDPSRVRYPTPLAAAGRDAVLIGRARADLSAPRGLVFFVVSDNLRKGAATNAIQIVERLASPPGSGPGGGDAPAIAPTAGRAGERSDR